jgi:hypothetical protein
MFYGNIAHSSRGDPLGSPRVQNHSDYGCLDNGSAYIVDKPTHVWTNASNDATTLEEKWFFYDQQGFGGHWKGESNRRSRQQQREQRPHRNGFHWLAPLMDWIGIVRATLVAAAARCRHEEGGASGASESRKPPLGGSRVFALAGPARSPAGTSALARLETRVRLADHEDLATTADDFAVAVTVLRRLQGGQDLHDNLGNREKRISQQV